MGVLRLAVVAALALLTALTTPAAALPVAGAYPSRNNALAAPNDLEKEALDLIQREHRRSGAGPLAWDPLLSAVAREQSQDMADNNYVEYASPRLGTIEYRLHRSGISGANSRSVIYRVGSISALGEELKRQPLRDETATHVGIGVVTKGMLPREVYVTILLREKHSTVVPFPTQPLLGRSYRLAGEVERGYTKAMLIVTSPDGKVAEQKLELDASNRFDSVVAFDDGKGKYDVEITAQGKLGPAVLELMRCYAGVPYPEPDVQDRTVATPRDLRQAERIIFDMINRSRGEAGLAALEYDDDLARVARGHSEDMRDHRFFAHVSPTLGELGDRMARAGIKARRFTENIASNPDLAAAHRGLMESPGHRMNILDPDVTRVGVGIVRGEDKQLFVTENFMQDFTAYDPATVAADFLKAVNDARAAKGGKAMATDATLDRIALDNSKAMSRAGKLAHDTARSEMQKVRLTVKYVQIGILQSADPPKPEQMAETLKAKYSVVGIGVVQSQSAGGERTLWTTVLMGEK